MEKKNRKTKKVRNIFLNFQDLIKTLTNKLVLVYFSVLNLKTKVKIRCKTKVKSNKITKTKIK